MKVWKRWVALLDHRDDATSLALARIVAGYTVWLHLVTMWTSGAGLPLIVSMENS